MLHLQYKDWNAQFVINTFNNNHVLCCDVIKGCTVVYVCFVFICLFVLEMECFTWTMPLFVKFPFIR